MFRRILRGESGQASVDLVASLPVLLLAGALCWQLALAGHALWMGAQAARSGARAALVGQDARAAARDSLPGYLERGSKVERDGSSVRVRLAVPLLLPGRSSSVGVTSEASLGDGP